MGDKSEILKSNSPEKETAEVMAGSQTGIRAPEVVASAETEISGEAAEGVGSWIDTSNPTSENTADSESTLDLEVDQERLASDCIVRVRNNFKIFKKQPFLSRKKFIQLKDRYQKLNS